MNAEQWFKRGAALAEEGKWQEVVEAYDKAIEINPQDAKAWYSKGFALDELGRYEEAVEAYEKAIEIDPQMAEAWGNKGVALGRLGRHEEALGAYEKVIEINPQYAEVWYNKGFALGELGRHEEALEAYEKAIEIDPQDAKAWYNKGVALARLGRYEEALEAFEEALKIDAQHAEAWASKGVALSRLGHYEGALAAYDKAIQIDPQDAVAWYDEGFALDELGRYEEAVGAYDKAVEIDPQYADAWANKGFSLDELGRYEEALGAYDKAIQIDPRSIQAWVNKGVALHKLGRYDEALVAYDKAIEIDPQCAEAWVDKGVGLGRLGRYEEAVGAYDRAIEINPQYPMAWYNKGVALDELGRYEEALAAYDKAIEIDPRYAKAWHNKGAMLDELGRYGEAVGAYETAARLFGERGEEDDQRRARGYSLISKGIKHWAEGRFEDMKKPFTSASRVFKELGEDDVASSLGVVSRLIPMERGFLDALAQDSLESTRECLRKLMRRMNRLRPAIDKCEMESVRTLLEAKLDCITVLTKSLEFEEDDLYQTLTRAEMVFKDHNFPDALRTVNNLKNFVLDLKEYPSLEAISEEEKERLVLALHPFRFLDGALTEDVVGRIAGEPYLAEPTETKPREEPVSLVSLHSGPPQSPVTICVAQIDYELEGPFPFCPSDPEMVREKILRVLSIARQKEANIVCFPELCIRQEWSEEIAEASGDKVIIAGSYYDERRNTCLILTEGKKYVVSKINPSPWEEEIVPGQGMVPGEKIRAFQIRFGVLVPLICLDFTREHHRVEKYINNGGQVHFLFVPSYDDSEDNLGAYHERASRDSQEHDLYVFISNVAKGGGTSAFGLEHNRRLQNLESRGLKPQDQFTYKWAEIQKGKEGVIIATVNIPAGGVAPYSKERKNLVRIESLPLE